MRRSATQAAQHEVENAAAPVVLPLVGCVDSHPSLELDPGVGGHGQRAGALLELPEVEALLTAQGERLRRLSWWELQRQDAHPHEVGAMDAFVGLGDHE